MKSCKIKGFKVLKKGIESITFYIMLIYFHRKTEKRFDNLSTNIYNWRQIIEQEKKAIPLRKITFKVRTLPELAVQVVPKI